jgi:hypothetical protein
MILWTLVTVSAGLLSNAMFVAVQLDSLHKCAPKDLNVYAIGEHQASVDLDLNST